MKIILIEPFFSGSHEYWANGYQKNSQNEIEILSLKGIYWKWRMHGGAVTLANRFNEYVKTHDSLPDAIVTTDMLNLPVFISLTREYSRSIPIITYFHENQITYPWSPKDRDKEKERDHHYGFINYATALASNAIWFNSQFHKESFITSLRKFLRQFPDHNGINNVDIIEQRSHVNYLGLDLQKFNKFCIEKKNNPVPIILWNHRWEFDKNPDEFFSALEQVKDRGLEFKLVVLGEEFDTEMPEFTNARNIFRDDIIHFGYCKSFADYANWLWRADILPVTSHQEFFGASVMEAVYCNTIPLLPNRLTYPELFQKDKNPNYFYSNQGDLVTKLSKMIREYPQIIKSQTNELALQFDWQNIAPKYDEMLEQIK